MSCRMAHRILLFYTVIGLGIGCSRDEQTQAPVPPKPVDLTALKERAEKGDVAAEQALGEAYETGNGGHPDYAQAAKWLTKAAEHGNADAQAGLAELYEAGQGVKQNYGEAASWYRKAAEQGNRGGAYGLAVLYAFGRGVPVNDKEAAKWYLQAAQKGEPLAQYNIGQRYLKGRGVAADPVEAYKWFSVAAPEVTDAATARDELGRKLSREQTEEARRRIESFKSASSQPVRAK